MFENLAIIMIGARFDMILVMMLGIIGTIIRFVQIAMSIHEMYNSEDILDDLEDSDDGR